MNYNKYQYVMGDHAVMCDICGKRRYASQCRPTWDGYLACLVEKCWYPKQAYDLPVPVINDGLPAYPARPQQPVVYLNVNGRSLWNVLAPLQGTGTWSNDLDNWDNA